MSQVIWMWHDVHRNDYDLDADIDAQLRSSPPMASGDERDAYLRRSGDAPDDSRNGELRTSHRCATVFKSFFWLSHCHCARGELWRGAPSPVSAEPMRAHDDGEHPQRMSLLCSAPAKRRLSRCSYAPRVRKGLSSQIHTCRVIWRL